MKEKLSDRTFRLMSLVMRIIDTFSSYVQKRAETIGITEGMTIVDYGCGPGRYTVEFARIVGKHGKVFAVDLSPVAKQMVEEKAKKYNLNNIQFNLANGYNSNLDNEIADIVVALDMFFMIEKPIDFLRELYRICKKDGVLVIDDGHQPRKKTKEKIATAGFWHIVEERKDVLICRKD